MLHSEDLIWLFEERCFGYVVELGSYYSKVAYSRDGIDYEVLMENNEFEFMEDRYFDHDDE